MPLKRGLWWHFDHVRREGWRAFAAKLETRFIAPTVGLLGAFVLRAFLAPISVWKKVYVVTIRTHRMGHLSVDPMIALLLIAQARAKDKESNGRSPWIIWLGHRRVANSWLFNAWRKASVPVSRAPWPGVDCYNESIRRSRLVTLIDPSTRLPREWGSFQGPRPAFTDREAAYARGVLRELGLPNDAPWVCINARDSAYLDRALPADWSEEEYRNSDIQTFVPAAKMFVDRGFYVMRMGALVDKPLLTTNPQIIDYANSGHRTELLDVFLSAGCHMFVSTGTGLDTLSLLYQKPLVLVNFTPFIGGLTAFANAGSLCVTIPQHHDSPNGSSWTLSNLLQEGLWGLYRSSDYQRNGITLRPNTSEEIQIVCGEALALAQASYSQLPRESQSHQAFWQMVSNFVPEAQYRSKTVRIGEAFLKANPCWTR